MALTSYFSGRDPDDLALGDPALWRDPLVRLRRGVAAVAVDRGRAVTDAVGRRARSRYDALVLATGSSAAVPPVPGHDLPGCFVYRTVDDVAALRTWVEGVTEQEPGDVPGAPSSAAGSSGSRRPARCRRWAPRPRWWSSRRG